MKASTDPQPAASDLEPQPDPVDSIVDDLTQQDILPVSEPQVLEDYPEVHFSGHQPGDDAGTEYGDRAPRIPLEDEAQLSGELVQDGLDEADEELRELEDDDGEEAESLR